MMISESEKSINPQDITEVEQLIGENLPRDICRHYLKSNGGYPEENYVAGDECEFTFQGFNPIKHGKVTVERLISGMRESFGLDKFFPFGFDAGGNIFYLSLEQEDSEHVYLITSDTHDKFFVCKHFSSFISSLKYSE